MPPLLRLVLRNGASHRGRTILTLLVIAVAVMAFSLLQTAVKAYYIGVEASSPNRLVSRHSVSLMFALPLAYEERMEQVSGVKNVSAANWFGGYFQDPKNFFAQFAIDDGFLDLYPEYLLSPDEKKAFLSERTACVVGEKLAARFGWKLGDRVPITGTIFPGSWEFTIRGIYKGRDRTTDATQMFFRWDRLNEWIKANTSGADLAGFFVIEIENPAAAARVSDAIDALFESSTAQTLTETEQAFNLSFVSMAGALIAAIKAISFIVVVIVLLVMANTMLMSARERLAQFAVLKSVGFRTGHLVAVMAGEAVVLSMGGAALGLAIGIPLVNGFGKVLEQNLGAFFPVFELNAATAATAVGLCLLCGAASAVFPLVNALRTPIASALRKVD